MSLTKLEPTAWAYAQLPSDSVDHLSRAEWTNCVQFPTEIHLELRAAGVIPDWNKGREEHAVQWVSERHWAFKAEIAVDLSSVKGLKKAELEFEGLDTFATVYLNGDEILKSDNHFLTYNVAVPHVSLKEKNELVILFRPPQPVAEAIASKYGPFRGGSCNLGDRARMGIRKSQYHFRWDWGPEIKCMGPDRPIFLRLYASRIKGVNTAARVDEQLARSLRVSADIEGEGRVRTVLRTLDGTVIKSGEGETVDWALGESVKLWWPHGSGEQTLYQVQVDLLDSDDRVVDSLTRKIGFRRARLAQNPLEGQEGTSFYFEINNQPIFAGGSNWIPIDMALPSATPERYRRWLEMMVKGNQNMIRIWGGGVFEPDVFYEICDELGILVWQDFMFACGVYPVFPEFMESVQKEAECNVKRLRHHPSLALFCGNNEDYQMVLQWDIDQAGDPLPARKIYEHLLPDVVSALTDPEIPYHRGSPYGGKGWDTSDPTVGDVHQWDVWGGKEKFYQHWDILGGRFVSEFGMPSLPSIKTIDYWLDGDTSQRYPQSRLMQQHNKAGSHERRFAIYMNENFRYTGDLEEYAYLTKLMQSEAVGLAYSLWRREWKGPGKEYCAGVLAWQLNDCWPVSSWAIIDYFYRPKPAFFAIARNLAVVDVGIRRTVTKNRENDRPSTFYEYGAFQTKEAQVEIWGANSGEEVTATVFIEAIDLNSSWKTQLPAAEVVLGKNRSTEIWKGACPEPETSEAYDKSAPSGSVVLHARIMVGDVVVARSTNWPEPYKLLDLPNPGLSVTVQKDQVELAVEKPLKGLWLDVEGDDDDGIEWEDNNLDLWPGEKRTIKVKGLNGRKVTVAYLGKEKSVPV